MAHRSDVAADVMASAEAAAKMTNISDKRHARERARRIEAVSLRLAGLTYEQIGERLGITKQGVLDLVTRTLERAENEKAHEMRALEGARLDRAQAAIWSRVLEGDTKAIDTYLRISQRRARLFGLEAPTQIAVAMNVRTEMVQALENLEQIVLGEVISRESAPADGPLELGGTDDRGGEEGVRDAEGAGGERGD